MSVHVNSLESLTFRQAIFDELVGLVDPGVEPYKPKKGQPNVIMAVGLQVRHYKYMHRSLLANRVCNNIGKRQNDHLHQTRRLLSKTGVQIVHRLRGHLPCGCLRPNATVRHQSQGRLLWVVHRDGPGVDCGAGCGKVQEGEV